MSLSPSSPARETAPGHAAARAAGLLRALGSLKLTLAILVLLAAGVVVAYRSELRTTWALVLPLGLFALNLLAAIASNPAFRRSVPLLVFHLGLLALIVLIALGRLSYLKGGAEVTVGESFDGRLRQAEAGPWHGWAIEGLRFVNEGFSIRYHPGTVRDRTENRVRWTDAAGTEHRAVIGDTTPLVLAGYRFYTTFNKGYAPILTWIPDGGTPLRGSLHLPAYPGNAFAQASEWAPPGSPLRLWVMLEIEETVLDPDRESRFRVPARHHLVVRAGEARHELRPGSRLRLDGGWLAYEELRSWMGYHVFYDWTIPWLAAACVVAVGGLAWHFWRKYFATPWDR